MMCAIVRCIITFRDSLVAVAPVPPISHPGSILHAQHSLPAHTRLSFTSSLLFLLYPTGSGLMLKEPSGCRGVMAARLESVDTPGCGSPRS